MNKEELIQFVQNEARKTTGWQLSADLMRQGAQAVESIDPTMATLMRRVALSIEQYFHRIKAYQEIHQMDHLDKILEAQEQERLEVEALISRALTPPPKKEPDNG
jgi:hypothetical protein